MCLQLICVLGQASWSRWRPIAVTLLPTKKAKILKEIDWFLGQLYATCRWGGFTQWPETQDNPTPYQRYLGRWRHQCEIRMALRVYFDPDLSRQVYIQEKKFYLLSVLLCDIISWETRRKTMLLHDTPATGTPCTLPKISTLHTDY